MRHSSKCLGIIIVFLSSSLSAQDDPANPNEPQVSLDERTLAVLPAAILTDDPRAPKLAETTYAAILNELATIDGLEVLSRETVLPYADSELSPAEIGRELGITYILESEIRIRGLVFHFALQYVNTRDETRSWGRGCAR